MNRLPQLFPYFLQKVVFLLFFLGLNACTSILPECGACSSPPLNQLNGTWELARWNQAPNSYGIIRLRTIPHGEETTPIFMDFDMESKRLSGFSGCNKFAADINEGSKGITLETIVRTKQTCASAQVTQFETDFIYELTDYRSLKVEKNQLLLVGRNGEVLLFEKLFDK